MKLMILMITLLSRLQYDLSINSMFLQLSMKYLTIYNALYIVSGW